jgi:predicted PurR-regulated permease PerM
VNSSSSTLNTLVISVIVIAALFLAREVLIPIALAGILSFMLAPPVRALQRLHLPRGLAVLAVVLVAFALIFALGSVMARQVTQLATDLPSYEATIGAKIEGLRGTGGSGTLQRAQQVLEDLGKKIGSGDQQQAPAPTAAPARPQDRSLIPVEVHEPSGGPMQTISSLISPLLGPLATTGMIVIFVMFILVQREDLRDRMIRLVGSTDIAHTTAAIDDAAHRLSHLFLTQLAINTGFAILIGLGLYFIGIPSAFLWGVLAGILRFIPYIGSILGMVFPLALALSVDPGWTMIIWTAALFLTLEIITGQVIEPVVEGHSTGLSPLAVVVAATFWAWLWGPVGLVLATPLTVILVVLGRHVDALKFLDVLFGDEPALSESESFYQRMLASDPVEAVEQAKAFMSSHSLADYCDTVARPGLLLAQKDAERGQLPESAKKNLRDTIGKLLADIAHEHWLIAREKHASGMATASKLPMIQPEKLNAAWRGGTSVLVIGVHGEFDEAAAGVLATLSETHGIPVRIETAEVLSAANLAKLDVAGTALICLSALDIKTPAHIHFAARRLRSRAPHAKLLLAVWSPVDPKELLDLQQAIQADFAASTFHQAALIIQSEAMGGSGAGAAEPAANSPALA